MTPSNQNEPSPALAVVPGSALPDSSHKTEYIVYYPMYAIDRRNAVRRYDNMDELTRDWGGYKRGIIVETVTSQSSFHLLKPNTNGQTCRTNDSKS